MSTAAPGHAGKTEGGFDAIRWLWDGQSFWPVASDSRSAGARLADAATATTFFPLEEAVGDDDWECRPPSREGADTDRGASALVPGRILDQRWTVLRDRRDLRRDGKPVRPRGQGPGEAASQGRCMVSRLWFGGGDERRLHSRAGHRRFRLGHHARLQRCFNLLRRSPSGRYWSKHIPGQELC
jgi:hypothetical protein